jgi:murein DD-endopeptidase MepM/ murein hydrolase activator NlpD
MTDFQIILLPEREYWSWVRACQDYVMAHGANLTTSRETAARYMAPRQVISFPAGGALSAEFGEFSNWIETNHAGVRLDPIEADTPRELEKALQARLDADDRYGQRQKPFYLLWPTDYPIITQRFGVNPQIYTRFGMPGHEGLDIRALPHSNIYACANGVVYRVHRNPNSHAYGIHVRVRHQSGYRTVYGHLAQSLVEENERVMAGQVIAKADSTGASTAAHLHFTLKQDGATARKETNYPKDVIDPTPFMVWPESSGRKSAQPQWLPGECVLGIHLHSQTAMEEWHAPLYGQTRIGAIKVDSSFNPDVVEALMTARPDLWVVVRLSAEKLRLKCGAHEFLQIVMSRAGKFYELGVRDFELHTSPNLQSEGWNRSWKNGTEYGSWFEAVSLGLKDAFTGVRVGFPGLSPGDDLSGWRQDEWRFLDEAGTGIQVADWVGLITTWTSDAGMRSLAEGRRHLEIRHYIPDKPLIISEFWNPSFDTPHAKRARQYAEFYGNLGDEPNVAAAFLADERPSAAGEGDLAQTFVHHLGGKGS